MRIHRSVEVATGVHYDREVQLNEWHRPTDFPPEAVSLD